LTSSEILLGLPDYEITEIEWRSGKVSLSVRYTGPIGCPECGSSRLRNKGWCGRQVRHEDGGLRQCVRKLRVRKAHCLDCGRHFRQRLPGIQPCQRASEAFQEAIYQQPLDGINRSRLGRREGIGAATVERYFRHGLQRQFKQWHPPRCPAVLGIDEHFFTRRKGYATTLCDLHRRKVYDVVLGRSEIALEGYLQRLEGKAEVRVVCIGSRQRLPRLGAQALPQCPHRGRPFSRHPHHPLIFSWPAGGTWTRRSARIAAC
jgi:transposase